MLREPRARLSAAELPQPVRAYEGAALQLHLAAIDAECDRLRSLIAAAEVRRDELLEARPLSVAEWLGTVMLDAQAQLSEEWEACRRTETAIEEATEAAVSRILADAHVHADSFRAIAGEVRVSRSDAAPDDLERWQDVHIVEDVIDLTHTAETEPARTA